MDDVVEPGTEDHPGVAEREASGNTTQSMCPRAPVPPVKMHARQAPSAWDLPYFQGADLRDGRALIERYRDQEIGAADASLVLLVDRYKTERLLTLDRRHFRVRRTRSGKP